MTAATQMIEKAAMVPHDAGLGQAGRVVMTTTAFAADFLIGHDDFRQTEALVAATTKSAQLFALAKGWLDAGSERLVVLGAVEGALLFEMPASQMGDAFDQTGPAGFTAEWVTKEEAWAAKAA